MWNCWECCKCFRQSPKDNTWGYACDKAIAQGFKNISIYFWMEKDMNRPVHWAGSFKPGCIHVFSKLCEPCQSITVEEYFKLLKGFCVAHDYRHQCGAGGTNVVTRRWDKGNSYRSNLFCAGCQKESKEELCEYDKAYKKDGFIALGMEMGASIGICEGCRPKLRIKNCPPIIKEAKIKQEQEFKRMFPNSYGY